MPKKKLTPEQIEEQKRLEFDLDLATQCARLKALQEREQAMFNEFQLQRDKLNHFWIIAKKQLEDKKAELRNKEREIQVSVAARSPQRPPPRAEAAPLCHRCFVLCPCLGEPRRMSSSATAARSRC